MRDGRHCGKNRRSENEIVDKVPWGLDVGNDSSGRNGIYIFYDTYRARLVRKHIAPSNYSAAVQLHRKY